MAENSGEGSYIQVQFKGKFSARQMSCNVGDVCKGFTIRLFRVASGYCGRLSSSITVSSNEAPTLQGAVWRDRPSTLSDEPDYVSTNSIDISELAAVTAYKQSTSDYIRPGNSKGKVFKFEFNESSLGATHNYLWIGLKALSDGWFGFTTDNDPGNWFFIGPSGSTAILSKYWMDYSAGGIGPAMTQPKISITSGANTICRYDNNAATVKWSNSQGSMSRTWVEINGHKVETNATNSGDNAGSFTFKPSDYGVAQGSSYTVKTYRKNDLNTVSDSCTMYTYTNPTESSLTKTKSPINADQTETFNWSTNEPRWKSKNLELHVQKMTIDGNEVSEVTDNSTGDIKTITLANIGRYVTFDPSQLNGQTATVIVTKRHKNDSNVPSVSTTPITFIVRRIPTQTVYKDSTSAPTSFKYYLVTKNSSDSRNGREIPENYAVDRATSKYIKVPIIYPSNTSSEDYGILHGYKVVVRFENGSTWEYDLNNDNKPTSTSSLYNTFINIPTDEMIYSLTSTLEITPYYKHSKTNYNITHNNQKYYGPTESRRFPSVITRLPAPNILYPTENSTWINKNYRVLLQLPADADFDNYGAVVASDYIYRDVEIQIRANGVVRTYTWGEDSAPKQREIFSLNKLSYQKKLALNPSLRSDYQSATTYEIRMRVRKKYGYPDAQADESWSEYSAWRKVNVSTINFSVNEGDFIMATHQNKVYDFINRMKTCYKETQKPMKTKKRNRGDYILASDYDVSYQDILDVYNLVNTWETKTGDFAKPAVKFKNGVALTEFSSTVGEYVTDLAHDTSPVGRNYITIMHDIANELK